MKEAKKMTILDLINKSVTDEEMPKKVEFDGFTYAYDEDDNDYYGFNDTLFALTTHYLDTVTISETESEIQARKDKRRFDILTDFLRDIADVEKDNN